MTINVWPEKAPGVPDNTNPEVDTTTAKDNLIAGKPLIRLGNVTQPTLTVYQPQGKNTGAAVVVFPEAATTSSQSIWKGPRFAIGSAKRESLAFC